MYEALYRKYRPQTFDDVAGQEHITETLKAQVRSGRLSHAYLFIGSRGTGKTTCARILAKAVNCLHPVDGNPCNCCESCRGIDEGTVLDVVELDAASNNGVEDVRLLRDEAVFSPTAVRKRVYIIDEVHMLSKSAFNALLKILEEPPEHLMFILATTELNKVLPTILSRCQRHSFHRLTPETIAKRLAWVAEQEQLELAPEAAMLLGRLAEGGMRDGLSLLDQCASRRVIDVDGVLSSMGLVGSYRCMELAGTLGAHDVDASLALFRKLWQEGKEPATLLSELSGLFRDALLLRLAPKGGRALLSGAYEEGELLALPLQSGALLGALNVIQRHQAAMKDAPNARLQCELCLIELCGVPAADFTLPSAPVVPMAAPMQEAPAAQRREQPAPVIREEEAPASRIPQEESASGSPKEQDTPDAPAAPSAEPPQRGSAVGSWEEALDRLKDAVPVGIYRLLSDEYQVQGRLEEGRLVLETMPGFITNMLNHPDLLDTMSASCGATVTVEERRAPVSINDDKLRSLGQFGNVTIQ